MKRIVLILLLIICECSTIHAEEEFTIETCGGPVEYKKTDMLNWQAVYPGLKLYATDSIRLRRRGYTTIEYRNNPYPFTSPCASSVYLLVEPKTKERSRQFSSRSFLQEIGTNKSDTLPFQMQQIGKSKDRERDTIDYRALAETLTGIGALACAGIESPTYNWITFNRKNNHEGELSFEYGNTSSGDLYINVLHVNKRKNKISLCYIITPDVRKNACPVTPSGYYSCNRGIYFPDTKDDIYILIAIPYPYNSYRLDNELSFQRIDGTKETNSIIYMW